MQWYPALNREKQSSLKSDFYATPPLIYCTGFIPLRYYSDSTKFGGYIWERCVLYKALFFFLQIFYKEWVAVSSLGIHQVLL